MKRQGTLALAFVLLGISACFAQTTTPVALDGVGSGSYNGGLTSGSGILTGLTGGTWQVNFTSSLGFEGSDSINCGPGSGSLALATSRGSLSLSLVGWVCLQNGDGQPLSPNIINVSYEIESGTGGYTNVVGGTGTVILDVVLSTSQASLHVNGNAVLP
jgi:hypothetical protein